VLEINATKREKLSYSTNTIANAVKQAVLWSTKRP